ncbi:MAG TPA: sugar transferase, partial [Bacteroidales bacterium]|nr:sugar transferase [Bacteroidales bacterium]
MERKRFRIITTFADIIILIISFLAVVWTKPTSFRGYIPSHAFFFASLAFIWIIVSFLNGKMHRGKIINFQTLFIRVVSSNLISISITTLIFYIFRDYEYSRTVVLGTALTATFLELVAGGIFIAYKKASVQEYEEYEKYRKYRKPSEYELVKEANGKSKKKITEPHVNLQVLKAIERECGAGMAGAITAIAGANLKGKNAVLSTTTPFNITSLPEEAYNYIINLRKLNDVKDPDEFIDTVNGKLDCGGYFLCCVETKDQRKKRILKKFPPVLNYLLYSIDFIYKRVLPKFKITRPVYFALSGGRNNVLSRAEALGRLTRGGFRIRSESFLGNLLCIESVKISDPLPRNENLYGPLIALPRVGKNGEMIKVFKLRTMYPYSEYIQDYVYRIYDLQEGGKFRNDFRVTSWGAVCRKIWIDELPMLINLFKGNMKMVGVRPLSRQYFDLYRKDVQERRIKYKPGLIPPFYADMPSDLDEIQNSELRYLDEYDRH